MTDNIREEINIYKFLFGKSQFLEILRNYIYSILQTLSEFFFCRYVIREIKILTVNERKMYY